jgi:hypothetical protein
VEVFPEVFRGFLWTVFEEYHGTPHSDIMGKIDNRHIYI